ncbi:MAG: MFS transporter, partial [Sutterellaceae bacterium]|nr:MFS transporter [Sutterellaceae bacterium]
MILRIIFFAMFLNASFMSLRVIASLDALGHGATPAEVGVLMALLALFPTFLAILCGRWIDRVGYHKPVISSAVLLLIAAVCPIAFPTEVDGMYALYVCCVTAGLGTMVVAIVSNYLVGACSVEGSRTKFFAWLTMGNSVAGFSTPVLAGYLIDGFGYDAAYGAAALMVLVGVTMYFVSYKELAAIPLPKPRKFARRAYDLLKDPRLCRILIVSSIISMAWDLETFMF